MRNGFCPTSLVQAGEPGERLPLKCCLLGVGSWRAQPKDGCSLEQPLASTLSIPQVPPSQLSKLLLFLSCSFLHMQIIPILTGSFTGVRVCSKSWGRVCWNHHSRVQQMLVCSSDEIMPCLGWAGPQHARQVTSPLCALASQVTRGESQRKAKVEVKVMFLQATGHHQSLPAQYKTEWKD